MALLNGSLGAYIALSLAQFRAGRGYRIAWMSCHTRSIRIGWMPRTSMKSDRVTIVHSDVASIDTTIVSTIEAVVSGDGSGSG